MRGNTFILSCVFLLPAIFGDTEKNETAFVPTREWQTVKEGTPIPRGLHVRHNFETGVTEAKLMDSKDAEDNNSNDNLKGSNTNSLTLHPEKAILEEEEPVNTEKPDYVNDFFNVLNAADVPEFNDIYIQKIKQKFKDYETLKKELRTIEVNITTDAELLSNYFEKFQAHKSVITMGTLTATEIEDILDILYNLEYLLHHVDNAKIFADMQGMSKIISPCLNGTNTEIKAEALRVLGAAVQSNPKVQVKALENDLVQKILHLLLTNSKTQVKKRCLFALSALIRQFPAAQKVWIDHGGVEIFRKILLDGQFQIQIKVLRLINDIIVERQIAKESTDTKEQSQKMKAYAAVDIEQKLLMYDYCEHLLDLMRTQPADKDDEYYEFIHTVLESMFIVAPICTDRYYDYKLLPVLSQLIDRSIETASKKRFGTSSSDTTPRDEL